MKHLCVISKNMRAKGICIFKALVVVLAFSMTYPIVEDTVVEQNYSSAYSIFPLLSKFVFALDDFSVWNLIFFFLVIKFYQVTEFEQISKECKVISAIVAFLGAFSLLIGNAIYLAGSIEILFEGIVQSIKACFIFMGYFMFIYRLCICGCECYMRYMNKSQEDMINVFNRRYIFWSVTGLFIISWIPILFAYYPAIFMGDTEDIIYMAYNYPTGLLGTVKLRQEGVNLTNHHPVIFTLIVGTVLKLVRGLGGSDNMAIFVYALVQYLASALILSYVCLYIGRDLKKKKVALCAVLFYVFCPWITKYVIMISKDTFFSECLLLLCVQLHKVASGKNDRKQVAIIAFLSIFVLLFRKNGLYVLMITYAFMIVLYRKYWKSWGACLVVVLVCNSLYSNILLPVAGITDGSVREALSIPFQQTARYVRDHGEEVTEEEQRIIDAVLQYDVLGEVYSANISDPVKATFRIEADSEDLKEYFAVWFAMLLKHPETYIKATINNYYGYVYPVVNDIHKLYRTSVGSMENANRDGYFNFSNNYDGVRIWLRDAYALWDLLWMKVPIVNLFATSAFYVWLIILAGALKVICRDRAGLGVMFMYFILILTAVAGPCNAIDYERYISPCIFVFPLIVGIALQKKGLKEELG